MTDKKLIEALILSDFPIEICTVEETESTNICIREAMEKGAAEGYTVIAEAQTRGEGRLFRSFYSPERSGLYMSILLRPRDMEKVKYITATAAVALRESILKTFRISAQIKWVNDIYINQKKVAGILAKSVFEGGRLSGVILGVGINIYRPEGGFPEEIRDIAAALLENKEENARERLSAAFLSEFFSMYGEMGSEWIFEKYRYNCLTLKKEVEVTKWGEEGSPKKARAIDINRDFNLLVEYENKERELLQSGEVSVKL